jgi:sugar (pentulose or hexulose) kinase
MLAKNYIVAIDSGTQSVRAVLFNKEGELVAMEQVEYEPFFSQQPGWAEHRTEDYWDKLCRVCRGLMNKIDIDPRQIRSIALTSHRNTVIRDIPPGSMGLMLQPHWSPKVHNKFVKGVILGFGDVHTRAHVYRAILEGLCFELRHMQEIVQKKNGVPLRELRVGGGGSRSDVVIQIAADMFNLPASRMATSEISALGAAIDAAVATGLYPSFDAAVAAMVHKGKTFQPDAQTHRIYSQLFHEVYKQISSTMAPIYRSIARITGYPAHE